MYWDGDKIKEIEHYVHLEHDGRILLVDGKGKGPRKARPGRQYHDQDDRMRLPTPTEWIWVLVTYLEESTSTPWGIAM